MIGVLDLLAVLAACGTTITCFLIRSSHGTDVDELEEALETERAARAKTEEELRRLTVTVTHNGNVVNNFKARVETRLNLGPK